MSITQAALVIKCPSDVPRSVASLKALDCFHSSARAPFPSLSDCLRKSSNNKTILLFNRINHSQRHFRHRGFEWQHAIGKRRCRGSPVDTNPPQSSDSIAPEHPIRTLLLDNYDSYTYNLFQLLSVVNGVAPVVLRNDEITWDELCHLLYEERAFHNVVISPGPGSPAKASDVGVCNRLLQECFDIPILGVCLGHQALGYVHGAQVLHAPEPMHGRLSDIEHCGHPLFASIPSGLNSGFKVVRYHSLVIDAASLPEDLVPTAWAVAESRSIRLGACQAAVEHSADFASNADLTCQGDGLSSGEKGDLEDGVGSLRLDDAGEITDGRRSTRILMGVSHRSRPHHGVQFHPESVATAYGKQLLLNFRSITMQFWEEQRWQPVLKGTEWKSFAPLRDRPANVKGGIARPLEIDSRINTSLSNPKMAETFMKNGDSCLKAEIQETEPAVRKKHELSPHGEKSLRLHYQKLSKLASRAGGSEVLFNKLFADENVEDTFWLDSSSLEQGRARFSFMGGRGGSMWQRITYRIASDNLSGTHGGILKFQNADGNVKETVLQGGFLDFLDRELKLHRCKSEDHAALPFDFCGGFIGYLGYELKGECGAKPNEHKSSTPDAGMFLVDRVVVVDHKHDDVYVLASFEDESIPRVNKSTDRDAKILFSPSMDLSASQQYGEIQSKDECKDRRSRSASLLGTSYIRNGSNANGAALTATAFNQSERKKSEAWVDKIVMRIERLAQQRMRRIKEEDHHVNLVPHAQVMQANSNVDFVLESSKAGYIGDVQKCQGYIKDGESYEVCLTTRLRRKVGAVDALGLYLILRETNPAPYASWLHFGKDGPCICSSSPERFLQLDGQGFLEAKPIKGTAARGDNPLEDEKLKYDLQNSKKDQAENLMIVDLLRNDLGQVCEAGSVHVPSLMSVESYSTVHTMVSTVRGKKRPDVSAVDCVRAAFPGGSMTGAPKLRTMEIIDSLEHSSRGVYSGSIGYFSFNSSFDLNIVIRTIVLYEEEASIGAGGAVVALSDPVAEYDEMLLKTKAPIRAVTLFEHAFPRVGRANRRGRTLSPL